MIWKGRKRSKIQAPKEVKKDVKQLARKKNVENTRCGDFITFKICVENYIWKWLVLIIQ